MAWLLAHMLSNDAPFGVDAGTLERLDFQTSPEGWELDDVLATTKAAGGALHRTAISIKSNLQFVGSSPPPGFVAAAWSQFLRITSAVFEPTTDFLSLATAPLDATLKNDLEFVVNAAGSNDPSLLPGRFAKGGWANARRKALFAGLACPAVLAATHGETPETRGNLIARLRFLDFDFDSSTSTRHSAGVAMCRRALRSGDFQEAQTLWQALLDIAGRARPLAGSISCRDLLARLQGRFSLAALPNHRHDRERLASFARAKLALVRDVLGSTIVISRAAARVELARAMSGSAQVVLSGPPGTGKSALAKALAVEALSNGQLCLWVDAASFLSQDYQAFEAHLGLTHSLAEIVADAPDAKPLLVLEGADRAYDPRVFLGISEMLAATGILLRSQWRTVIPCRADEWGRVGLALENAGIAALSWRPLEVSPPTMDDLDPVWKAAPQLGRLKQHSATHSALGNLKILDLVVRGVLAGGRVEARDWVGETNVADWFWEAVVGSGAQGASRKQFAMAMAEGQADRLLPSSSLRDLDPAATPLLSELAVDRVCLQDENDRVRFEHSVYREWACLRSLVARDDRLVEVLREKSGLPSWHRPIRLFAVRLLERSDLRGRWPTLLEQMESDGPAALADLFLEAPAFSMNAYRLLEEARPALLKPGRLHRLLGRFLAFATQPDPVSQALFSGKFGASVIAARFRYPVWYLWYPVLSFLHKHREEFLPLAAERLREVCTLWLKHAPAGSAYRTEMTELAIILGRRAHESRENFGAGRLDDRRASYELLLMAAAEDPGAVVDLALEAAGRGNDDVKPRRPRSGGRARRNAAWYLGGDPNAPSPEPWPEGPRRAVDDGFQKALLEGGALAPLMKAAPTETVEICLAALIEVPKHPWDRHHLDDMALGLDSGVRWHPPFYTDGPFLQFLIADFNHGLNLIIRLVDFATRRWVERAEAEAEKQARQEAEEGSESSDVGKLMRRWRRPPTHTELQLPTGAKSFSGDARVFGWFCGLGNPPSAIQAALMALEEYLYRRIEAKELVDEEVTAVLERASSTSFLGLLSSVAARDPRLLVGSLKPLLTAVEIWNWDIERMVQGRSHLMIGAFMRGDWMIALMQKFHGMEHRRRHLRDVVVPLYLGDPTAREALHDARAGWERRLLALPAGDERDWLERLVLMFTIENYRAEAQADGTIHIINGAAEAREIAEAEERESERIQQQLIFLPARCSAILDEGTGIPAAEIDAFWEALRKVDAVTALDAGARARAANALSGGAAVLLALHGDWLDLDATRREWCVATIDRIVQHPPPRDQFDSPRSISMWSWDRFAAESAAVLLAADRGNAEFRELAAAMVFAPHYASVGSFFQACARRRDVLADDLPRLRGLLMDSAYVRGLVAEFASVVQWSETIAPERVASLGAAADAWYATAVGAFVTGATAPLTDEWPSALVASHFREWEMELSDLPRRARHYRFDIELVLAAHAWMPLGPPAIEPERLEWVSFWLGLGDRVLARAEGSDDGDRDDIPHETEMRVLERLGALTASAGIGPDAPTIWRRVLCLPAGHPFWAEVFFRALHAAGLSANPVSPGYPTAYSTLAATALDLHERGVGARWPYHDDAWAILMGFEGCATSLWSERHGDIVVGAKVVIERWVGAARTGSLVAAFARWLVLDAARRIRLDALSWILLALTDGRRLSRPRDALDAVADLSVLVWEQHADVARADPRAFSAFQGVLRWCVDQQAPRALELLGRMGGLA